MPSPLHANGYSTEIENVTPENSSIKDSEVVVPSQSTTPESAIKNILNNEIIDIPERPSLNLNIQLYIPSDKSQNIEPTLTEEASGETPWPDISPRKHNNDTNLKSFLLSPRPHQTTRARAETALTQSLTSRNKAVTMSNVRESSDGESTHSRPLPVPGSIRLKRKESAPTLPTQAIKKTERVIKLVPVTQPRRSSNPPAPEHSTLNQINQDNQNNESPIITSPKSFRNKPLPEPPQRDPKVPTSAPPTRFANLKAHVSTRKKV